jgi:hypothetical protein
MAEVTYFVALPFVAANDGIERRATLEQKSPSDAGAFLRYIANQ